MCVCVCVCGAERAVLGCAVGDIEALVQALQELVEIGVRTPLHTSLGDPWHGLYASLGDAWHALLNPHTTFGTTFGAMWQVPVFEKRVTQRESEAIRAAYSLLIEPGHTVDMIAEAYEQEQVLDVLNTAFEAELALDDGGVDEAFIPTQPHARRRESLDESLREESDEEDDHGGGLGVIVDSSDATDSPALVSRDDSSKPLKLWTGPPRATSPKPAGQEEDGEINS